MKILYLSDDYGSAVAGTKQSIYRELQRRGIAVEWGNIHTAGDGVVDGPALIRQLKAGGYTDLWLVHSWWRFDGCSLKEIEPHVDRVVSFGLSDPTGWDEDKLNRCHVYVTNDWEIYRRLEHSWARPCIFSPPACDVRFHRRVEVEKDIDVLFYGLGRHPILGEYRPNMIRRLRTVLPDVRIEVFGNDWPKDIGAHPHVTGEAFLEMIGRAKTGLDLTESPSPMGRRLFEMMACGLPVIARGSMQLGEMFQARHLRVWTDWNNLCTGVRHCLGDGTQQEQITEQGYVHVRTQHDVSNRVASILKGLG